MAYLYILPLFVILKNLENFIKKPWNKNLLNNIFWTSSGNWFRIISSSSSFMAISLSFLHLYSKNSSIFYVYFKFIVFPPLNFLSKPKNLCKSSTHSRSSFTYFILSIITMNLLKIYEKIVTPKIRMMPHNDLSKSLLGLRSPRPTVERDVNEK